MPDQSIFRNPYVQMRHYLHTILTRTQVRENRKIMGWDQNDGRVTVLRSSRKWARFTNETNTFSIK